MLKEKVKVALDNIQNKVDVFFADDGDLFQQFLEDNFDPKNVPGWSFTGKWEHLEHKYGQPDKSNMFQVYKYTENDESVYIQFSGWWSSYDGAEYGSWQFVTPVEQTVTVWQAA